VRTVAVVTDSVSCLPPDILQLYNIGIVPLSIVSEGKTYRDGIDITPTQAYELFAKNPDTFSTSAPSPSEFINAFNQAGKSASNVLYVSLSSKISSTYDAAVLAKEYVKQDNPGLKIEIVDSGSATTSEGFVAYAAAKSALSGASLTEVLHTAQKMKTRVNAFVLLDTVKHVYRSGRVPKIAAQAGSFFNVRALFEVRDNIHVTGVVRNRERGINTMFEKIKDRVGASPIHAAVMHAYALEPAIQLQQRASKELNCSELWLTEFSPIMGYACGTGTLGIAFYPI